MDNGQWTMSNGQWAIGRFERKPSFGINTILVSLPGYKYLVVLILQCVAGISLHYALINYLFTI